MTTYTNYKNPSWWDAENDSAWERAKDAFKRDWDQTKHDLGGDVPQTHQKIGNTVKQAAGKEAIPPRFQPTYEELEPAYRYGYGARSHYGEEYPEWDDELEARLREEWGALEPSRKAAWDADREAIQQAWDFEDSDDV
jgi:hypothetical protein